MEKTLEETLMYEFQKQIQQQIEELKETAVQFPLDRDEYVERVGRIRGLKEALQSFKEIKNTIFPST